MCLCDVFLLIQFWVHGEWRATLYLNQTVHMGHVKLVSAVKSLRVGPCPSFLNRPLAPTIRSPKSKRLGGSRLGLQAFLTSIQVELLGESQRSYEVNPCAMLESRVLIHEFIMPALSLGLVPLLRCLAFSSTSRWKSTFLISDMSNAKDKWHVCPASAKTAKAGR